MNIFQTSKHWKFSFKTSRTTLFGGLFFSSLLAHTACTPSSAPLTLSASQPTVMPHTVNSVIFEARQLGLEEDSRYNEIVVYDLTDCALPDCPINWRVLLPDVSGPASFYYGGIPTFGAQTIVPAKGLKSGRVYQLHVGPSEPRFDYPSGKLRFTLDSEGRVTSVK